MEENLPSGLVFQDDGRVLTTSLIVAREFGKDHRHVLRDIRELIGGVSKNGQTPMFEETTYTNEQNGQSYPMYLMNRDGFTLLAMGFTGEKALEFKMRFLQAFSLMEKLLTSDEYILARSVQIMDRMIKESNQRIQMLTGEVNSLKAENMVLAPKAAYTDEVLQSTSTYTHTQMAKELNFRSVTAFLQQAARDNILYKQSGMWMLYSRYAGKGYMKVRTTPYRCSDGTVKTNSISVWTEEGRSFLHKHFNVEFQPIDMNIPWESDM